MKITIDPGVPSGWAIWDANWNLLNYGIAKDSGSEAEDPFLNWQERMAQVTAEIIHHIAVMEMNLKSRVREIYIEYPSVFGGGVAAQSGAVVKLAVMVGYIAGKCKVSYIEFVPVNKWKGQMPKDVVEKRVKRLLPGCKATSHAVDAIGIALYLQGRL